MRTGERAEYVPLRDGVEEVADVEPHDELRSEVEAGAVNDRSAAGVGECARVRHMAGGPLREQGALERHEVGVGLADLSGCRSDAGDRQNTVGIHLAPDDCPRAFRAQAGVPEKTGEFQPE